MKLHDLILEAKRVYQNNFIKVDMIEEELKKIFAQADSVPTVDFDEDGMFLTMDDNTLREYNNFGGLSKFILIDSGKVDSENPLATEIKYYIEYTKEPEKKEPAEGEEGSEEA